MIEKIIYFNIDFEVKKLTVNKILMFGVLVSFKT